MRKRLRFPISESKIRQALKTLLELKLVERDPQGRLRPRDTKYLSGDKKERAVRDYHTSFLKLAARTLASQPGAEVKMGMTLPIRRANLERAKGLITEFWRISGSLPRRSLETPSISSAFNFSP